MKAQQTVLIIDDSSMIRNLIPVRLRELGVRTISAANGAEGIRAVQEHDPDLVLLDLNMPDMNGFEVCRLLKDDPETHDIPIIFITGSDESVDKVKGFDLGAIDYVIKPFDPAELCARVRAALRTKTLMDMLTTQAQLDGLTGLHNRRYFDERLKQEFEASQRYNRDLGLLMLDIDHFKKVNDVFGHPKGDAVLRHLARLLVESGRTSDVACRYGGEEFAIILPEASSQTAEQCGQRLLDAVKASHTLQSVVPDPITVSIGAASIRPDDGALPSMLVEAADKALYAAKENGRARVVAYQKSAFHSAA